MSEINEVRALLAPMAGGNILLPGSMIAEVISFSDPEPFDRGPDWLLGELRWNGWQIPVVNLALLAGTSDDFGIPERSRVLVVKTLSDSASVLHIGLVINGLPKLKNVTAGNLIEKEAASAEGIFSFVTIDDQSAAIPDLDALALSVEQSVYRH